MSFCCGSVFVMNDFEKLMEFVKILLGWTFAIVIILVYWSDIVIVDVFIDFSLPITYLDMFLKVHTILFFLCISYLIAIIVMNIPKMISTTIKISKDPRKFIEDIKEEMINKW